MRSIVDNRPVMPAHWTGQWVRHRLCEAFEIEARLPGAKHGRIAGSAWLFIVQHEFSDMVGWEDARDRVWQGWARAKGAHPWEVSRAEEAFGWLPLLTEHHDGERRCLAAWATLMARRKSVRAFLRARKWSRTTFQKRVIDASERLALELEIRGVQVR